MDTYAIGEFRFSQLSENELQELRCQLSAVLDYFDSIIGKYLTGLKPYPNNYPRRIQQIRTLIQVIDIALGDELRTQGIHSDKPQRKEDDIDMELFRYAFIAGIECLATVGPVSKDKIALTRIYLEPNIEQAIEAYKARKGDERWD